MIFKLVLLVFLTGSTTAKIEEVCTMQEGTLVDKATGISFDLDKSFSSSRTKLALLGESVEVNPGFVFSRKCAACQ